MVIKKTKNILNKRNKKSKKIKEITGGFLGIKSKRQKQIKYNIKKQLKEQGNTGEKYNSKKYNPIISNVENYFKLQKKTLKSKPNSQNISKVVKSFMNAYTGPQTEKKSRNTISNEYLNISGLNKPSNNSRYLTIEPVMSNSKMENIIAKKRKAPPTKNGSIQRMGPDGNLITIRRSNNEYAKLIPQVFNPEYVVYNPTQKNTNPYNDLGTNPIIPFALIKTAEQFKQVPISELVKYIQQTNSRGREVVPSNKRKIIQNIINEKTLKNEETLTKQIAEFSEQRIANQISQGKTEEATYANI